MKKRFKWLLFLLSMIFVSCKTTNEQTIIGGDQDKYGCKGSAGYQWSELRKECIRSFELPLQLFNQDRTFGAGVYFLPDSSKSEVFCKEGRFILDRIDRLTYKNKRNGYFMKIENNRFFVFDKTNMVLYH